MVSRTLIFLIDPNQKNWRNSWSIFKISYTRNATVSVELSIYCPWNFCHDFTSFINFSPKQLQNFSKVPSKFWERSLIMSHNFLNIYSKSSHSFSKILSILINLLQNCLHTLLRSHQNYFKVPLMYLYNFLITSYHYL